MTDLYAYQHKENVEYVLVTLVLPCSSSNQRCFGELAGQLEVAGARFGFRTAHATDIGKISEPAAAKIAHLIVVIDRPFNDGDVQAVLESMPPWHSASLAFAYANVQEMVSFEGKIDDWKRAAGDRLNFLLPDVDDHGRRIVSAKKILDNAVCDTVRVKYTPLCISRELRVPPEVLTYFAAASELYAKEKMYLRAPSDGYIAMRYGEGFFVTATKTNKIMLDNARISFIENYDRFSNELTYRGAYLPSSDAVEASILLSARDDISVLLHTHASRSFTRNPKYSARVLVPQLPYGEPELGDALVEALARVNDGFVIMEEHGEVFAGKDIKHLSFVENLSRQARSGHSVGSGVFDDLSSHAL